MRATGSVLLNSGGYLALRGAKINADKDVTLLAAHNADLNYRELDGRFNALSLCPARLNWVAGYTPAAIC